MHDSRRALGWLALAASGLVSAWLLQRFVAALHLAYLARFAVVSRPAETPAVLGPCELFMYRSSEALGAFLSFLLLYFAFVLVGRVLVGDPSHPRHRLRLVAWSLYFLVVALGAPSAIRLLEGAVALFLALSLPLRGAARGGLILGVAALFLATRGKAMVHALGDQQFVMPQLPDLAFPCSFLALALLVKFFRRALWLALEAGHGALPRRDLLDVLVYLLGLPFLMGNAVTPSPRHVAEAKARGATLEEGARSLAGTLGAGTLVLTALVMLASYPTVRLFFPACDIGKADLAHLWGRVLLTLPVEYLFLLATEQGSVGVARLFGYGLRDNFHRPLLASTPAQFWQRWDLYWREFLVSAFFIPVSLGLARRDGEVRRWHLAPAIGVTFLGTWTLNLIPLTLLGGLQMAPSLAIYYLLQGTAVAASLLVAWPGSVFRAGRRAWLGVAGTFVLMAVLRVFANAHLDLGQQVHLLQRAFGLLP